MSLGTPRRVPSAEFRLPVRAPFRLDLTANVLRRLSTNVVDVIEADGAYRRALATPHGVVLLAVVQEGDALRLTVRGPRAAHPRIPGLVARMLGTGVNLAPFYRASANIPWLAPLAARMRGVRPPRYPSLWEACVNAVTFQQVSLFAAGAIMRRFVESVGAPLETEAGTLHVFPSAARVVSAGEGPLSAAGMSTAKTSALLGIASALSSRELDEAVLERLSSVDAAAALGRLRGIGPWTAAVILLRGLGRLDVFPQNDSGVARSLAFVTEGKPVATEPVLEALGEQRGMLYYHLLLARLEASGEL